ncbi:MAG: hypothetical protein KL787_10025 [Taibaiella sp.]|nr:hypothetical protein [Taibaiella sp.]
MALFTKKEFAEKCGMMTKNLSVYVGRGQVIVRDDKLIDDSDPINQSFLQKHSSKIMTSDEEAEIIERVNSVTRKINLELSEMADSEDSSGDLGGIPSYKVSEQLLKYLDTKKREKEVLLLEIKRQKLEGEVIPSELIPPVILQMNHSLMTEIKNELEEVLRTITNKHRITHTELSEYRRMVTDSLNSGASKAAASAKASIQALISEYSEKRGVGERN